MRNTSRTIARALPAISPRGFFGGAVGLLLVAYVGLMAFTMSYAVIHAEYAERARDEEARIGGLEERYFALLQQIDAADPYALGYVKPVKQVFALVPSAPAVAAATR